MKGSDHVLAVLKAGISAIPIVGGPLASLISDYVPLSSQRSMERAVELLRDNFARLQNRIDSEAVDKDEFAELFKSGYIAIMRTHREEKLRAVTGLLTNLLLKSGDPAKVSYTELDHLIRCVDSLSIGAINVLGAARKIADHSQVNANGNYGFTFDQLQHELPEFEASLLMGLVSELAVFNLLRTGVQPPIGMPRYGNYPIELTPIGRRFVEKFIEGTGG